MAMKLKDAELTSVDFVGKGANQDAHFKLLKKRDEGVSNGKSAWELFKAFMKGTSAYSEEELKKNWSDKIQSDFGRARQRYMEALGKSISGILENDQLSLEEKRHMMRKSLEEFSGTMEGSIEEWHDLTKSIDDESLEKALTDEGKEGEGTMKIDKSKLTPEELAQYEALVKKASAEEVEKTKEKEIQKEKTDPEKKDKDNNPSANEPKKEEMEKDCDDKLKKAFDQEFADLKKNMETLQKSHDMEAMRQVAKKYTLLGKKEDELAETLYEMKKSGSGTYDQYIALLDENLALVEKGGLFSEIGKSGNTGRYVGSDADSKIESVAAELRKADPKLSYNMSIAKAWEENPDLAADYERAYMERR